MGVGGDDAVVLLSLIIAMWVAVKRTVGHMVGIYLSVIFRFSNILVRATSWLSCSVARERHKAFLPL